MGKGSKPRPILNWNEFAENWDKIFDSKTGEQPPEEEEDKRDAADER